MQSYFLSKEFGLKMFYRYVREKFDGGEKFLLFTLGKLYQDPDLDPHWIRIRIRLKMLDPDLHIINADPKHYCCLTTLVTLGLCNIVTSKKMLNK
jgi:hypothetical protein